MPAASISRGGLLLAGLVLLPLATAPGQAVPAERVSALETRLRSHFDSLHAGGRFPGGTLGVALPDGRVLGLAVGYADSGRKLPMRATDLMLAGSVGKTFFAALALALVREGRLGLDQPIAKYLGGEPWFSGMPNGHAITVRMLLNHTSGLDHYPASPGFLRDFVTAVGRDPDKLWRPEELIGYAFAAGALFPAGRGWHYADTNYLVLALVLERVTGTRAYDEIERRFLRPLGLTRVVPAVSRTIPGLVQGYAGPKNPFGGADAMMAQGRFVFNPRFEWGGGGFAATSTDLARWAQALWGGRVIPADLMPQVLDGRDASSERGEDVRYGLGVYIWRSTLGTVLGHGGLFPGYTTAVRYYPDYRFAVALQVNTSVSAPLGKSANVELTDLGELVVQGLGLSR